jgi:uncharacterized membrane protein YkoI
VARLSRLPTLLAIVALVVTGCGSDDPADDAGPSTPAAPTSSPTGDVAAPSDAPAVSTVTPSTDDPATSATSGPAQPTSGTPSGSAAAPSGGATSGAATASRPPVGVPGGVPGAEPLTPATETALLAVLTAEGEAGGQAYRLERDGAGWLVTVKVFDGARVVSVAPEGDRVAGLEEAPAGEETAALDVARVALGEAGELALAEVPGDLASVVLAQDGDLAVWEVTVTTGDGPQRVRIDVAIGEPL